MNKRFKLSGRSINNLVGVDDRLVNVVNLAILITEIDFAVIEGVRDIARQRQLYEEGATKTLNSKHLTGRAVDLAAFSGGEIRWDWPLYEKLADAMKLAAHYTGVKITWGGDWVSFKDGPHFELNE